MLIYEQIEGTVEDGYRLIMACLACAEELNVPRPTRDKFRKVPEYCYHSRHLS